MTSEKESQQQKIASSQSIPQEILIAEFNYARETAAQAMDDRHKMVNFFLIIVGILANAIGLILFSEKKNVFFESVMVQKVGVGIILLLVFLIGLLYLLKLVHLRMAWFESALCMNQVKDYYDERFPQANLKKKAFRWTRQTLISQDISKLTTIFGLSALLIICIDSCAFLGFLLCCMSLDRVLLSIGFFAVVLLLQVAYYKLALSEKRLPK